MADDMEFEVMKRQAVTALQMSFYIYRIANMISKADSNALITKDYLQELALEKPFVFTGKDTDLGYFYNNEFLPIHYINELDNELREKVTEVFNNAYEKGLVEFNTDENAWQLTISGKQALCNLEFRNCVIEEQETQAKEFLSQKGEIEVSFEFDGKMSDMGVFLTNDKVNITDFEGKNKKISEVVQNFLYLENKGFITISEDGDMKPTELGYKFLQSDTFKENCAERALNKTIIKQNGEKVACATKEALEKTSKEASKEVIKATANTVTDGALASAPTGVTQGIVVTKKVVEIGANVLNIGNDLTKTKN